MTKTDIDLMLQEFHEQLHIPLLDATTEAYRQGTLRAFLRPLNSFIWPQLLCKGL